MKNTSLVLIVVLFIAVAGIYILHFSGNKLNGSGKVGANEDSASSELKIAYIKVDSLVVNYDFAQEMHDGFSKQQEAFTKEYGDKRSRFESQAAAFQEKVQRGGFLTQERAMQERDRLVGEEQQITKLDQELSSKLSQIQADNNKQLLDSLLNYLKIYNKDKKYSYILNAGEVLIGDESYNITKEVLVNMNARFSKARSK
jgi:outer membrane protein